MVVLGGVCVWLLNRSFYLSCKLDAVACCTEFSGKLESLVTKGDRNSPAQSCHFSDLD